VVSGSRERLRDQSCEVKTLKDGSVRYHVTATVEDSARLDWFPNRGF
jgi:hypothetical protein